MSIGTLINNAIGNSVAEALSKEAAKPSNDLTQADANKITPSVESAVKAAITTEVKAVVEHNTNQEPWYKSRVTLGALMAIGGAGYTLFLDFMDPPPPTTEALSAQLGIIVGGITTLWGRWIATKPIGE